MMMDKIENLETLINEFIETVEEIGTFQKSLYSDYQPNHSFDIEIDDFRHIMIIFASDLHFGSIYTDYSSILRLWNFILQKESVYIALNGDIIDNFDLPSIKHMTSGVNSQVITPQLQRELFMKFLTALVRKGKLLSCVLGNHEAFSHQYPYFQLIKNIPVSLNRMFLNLKVLYQKYKIAMVHKSRFNSVLNPIHSSFRELIIMYPNCDIVVTSHTHLPAVAVIPYPTDGLYTERILIKTGTLKTDIYTTSHFSHPPNVRLATPSVVLNPIERRITPFTNYEDAYRFMIISSP